MPFTDGILSFVPPFGILRGLMVKALACRVEGPRFQSHPGKFGEKIPAILGLHDGSPDDKSVPQLIKRAG